MSYQGNITTALQFMASFRGARVIGHGSSGKICWMEIFADEDGTEEQHFFIMERRNPEFRVVELKIIMNMSSKDLYDATMNPEGFWLHPSAHTPQH